MVIIPGKRKNLTKRYYAAVIDYAIVMILIVLYVQIAGDVNEYGEYKVVGWSALAVPVIWFIYFPLCEGTFGQTVGKRLFNLHVVDINGMAPHVGQVTIRRVFDMLDIFTLGASGLLLVNYTETNQRLGDMLAETTVIKTDAICRHCGTVLELSPREVVRNVFDCPVCHTAN